jgi:hypothetical protein
MSAPSPTLDPRTNSVLWSYIVLNGIPSPGSIPRGGVRGFKRKTGWDKQRGKGTQGAKLTIVTVPPVDGEIAFQLIAGFDAQGRNSTDFEDWDAFVKGALTVSPAKPGQQAQGLTISYPGFASIGLTSVVVEDYSPPDHVGKGLYIATIKLCEWQQPPPVSIVKTVTKTAAAPATGPAKFVQPPDIQQRENTIRMLEQANKVGP